jgi:hypothetical protein
MLSDYFASCEEEDEEGLVWGARVWGRGAPPGRCGPPSPQPCGDRHMMIDKRKGANEFTLPRWLRRRRLRRVASCMRMPAHVHG